MKTLSLIQPWASLIMIGLKNFETRSWATKHRGRLLIHASAKIDKAGRELWETDPVLKLLRANNQLAPFEDLPRGFILGTVCLHSCIRTDEVPSQAREPYGDFSPGRFAWLLTVLERFEMPIPAKGKLGLWEYPGILDYGVRVVVEADGSMRWEED